MRTRNAITKDAECDNLVAWNCGDHACSIEDSRSEWAESPASSATMTAGCRSTVTAYNGSEWSNPRCSLDTVCIAGRESGPRRSTLSDVALADMDMDDLHYCDNALQGGGSAIDASRWRLHSALPLRPLGPEHQVVAPGPECLVMSAEVPGQRALASVAASSPSSMPSNAS